MMNDNKALERAEIIAALRYCASEESCKGCPLGQYDDITCAGFSDMLRSAASLLEQDAEPPNEPLTLTELRGMDGEPVWVQTLGRHQSGQWVIVAGVDAGGGEQTLYCQGGCTFRCYGKTCLAYRRKADGGGE